MIAEGSLQDFSLSDLLQIISLNASTGVLRLSSEGREGMLSCVKGEIVSATAQDLAAEEAVYALFQWETGTFKFDAQDPVDAPGKVATPLSEIAKEGIRRLDQWRSIRRELPLLTTRARFRSEQAELASSLTPASTEVWATISGTEGMTLAEIAQATHLNELAVAQGLLELFREGMLLIETSPEEAMRSMFQRASEEVYARFASISGLKMTEGLETLLNSLARTKGVELRWRSGLVQDGLPGSWSATALKPVYRDFLVSQLEYVTKIHGASFTEKALEGAISGFSPEEKQGWQSLELPETLTARLS